METFDFLIIGAGIFGLPTAIELRRRNYSVAILNPDTIPHPLASSTDISKLVRMEYGPDLEYMDMGEYCLQGWRDWNEMLGETLFHEVGFLIAAKQPLEAAEAAFETTSYRNLISKGYHPQRLSYSSVQSRFPAFNYEVYVDGFYNPYAGYVESGRVIKALANYAAQLGVAIHEGQTVEQITQSNNRVTGVKTSEGAQFSADHVIVCAGVHTPYLVPELMPYMKITGHPLFHLKPHNPELFAYPHFTPFAADIANSGWYGFPLHPTEGVVKIGNHGIGVALHPDHDARVVTAEDEAKLRTFLREAMPALADAPIVYTRRCLYTDTLDGHFWIDRHPSVEGLTIGTGGSGHALKMGPVLGELIAAAALGEAHPWGGRFRWRGLTEGTKQEEAARYG